MKKCLVTGGCGFIGSNLTRRLVSEGWSVDVVDNMSNGYLENLEGLKIRVLPNASFLRDFEKINNQTPGDHEVLVISDDFSHPSVLERITSIQRILNPHTLGKNRLSKMLQRFFQTYMIWTLSV